MKKVFAVSFLAVLTVTAANAEIVSSSRTINGKALNGNITLAGSDVKVTGYSKASSASAVAATDTINQAIGKLEKALDGKQASGSYASSTQGGKADTAIQGVKVNGTALTKDSSNIVSVTVPTSASDVGAVPTSRTVNSKALSSDVTLAGSDVKVTGYAKASSVAAIAETDTINQAIGKLEKALDGKQASGSYQPAGSYVTTSRTVNGKALSSDITLGASDVGAVAVAQGSSGAKKVMSTNSSGNVVAGTITGTGNVVVTVADNGNITVAGTQYTLPDASTSTKGGVKLTSGSTNTTSENVANKLTDKTTSITQAHLESTSEYPSMAVAQAMIESYGETNLAGKVNKTIAGDKDSLMVRNGSGTYAKGVSSDITVATVSGTTTVTVNHATKANQIPSGSENSSTYASIWVE